MTYKTIETDRKTIDMKYLKLDQNDRLLDIGGGGEGILSLLFKRNVVAIDVRPDELDEVNDDSSLKIVMDASNMLFRDNQFDYVTAFFTFMYIDQSDQEQVMKEICRVLKPGGKFHIWDTDMPSINDVEEDIYVLQLSIQIPDKTISTGYGVQLKNNKQNLESYKALCESSGLTILESEYVEDGVYHISCKNNKDVA
jgi:ubiquinone/menaquinone biosynthesis C-methylase UbiE